MTPGKSLWTQDNTQYRPLNHTSLLVACQLQRIYSKSKGLTGRRASTSLAPGQMVEGAALPSPAEDAQQVASN
jgi:hypothetical protein